MLLVQVVSKISGFIKRLIREDIGLVFSLPDDALLVNVDAGQIEQVMLNLTTNARDAMPQSGTLSVSVRRGVMGALGMPDGDTPCAIISVADTGCGMNPETRERIFDPFFTTKEFGKGSGLGLAMVFGIVAQHGGYINVQSELGAGSVFHVYLPLVVEEGVPLLLADGDEYAFSISQYGETILVVEDEKSTRLLLVEVLKKAGYSVIEAANGTDALEKFKAGGGNIRLVISDVVMPNMGGKKLYDEIRALSESVPFIFMSGHGSDVIHVGGTLDATIDLLEKPLMPLALLAKVQQLLD